MLYEASAVAAAIAAWMTQAHYPEPIKHAFLHRIKQESGFNPQAVSSGGRFHCLIQWDKRRYRQLLHFAHFVPDRRNACPTWDKQMAFMHHELVTVRQYHAVWRANPNDAYHVVTAAYFGGAE